MERDTGGNKLAGKIREIKKTITGMHTQDGAGVKLVRVLGYGNTKDFDPFLMLDAFDNDNPEDYIKGFPWHPHRGIETVTYLIHGDIEHGDSLGNKGSILDGETQWMTAGSGIIHQEMPKPSKRMLGVQLWLNLPAKDKMTEPRYHGITKEQVPVVRETGALVRVIAGQYGETKGAFEGDFVKPVYLDVELDPGARWSVDVDPEHTMFIYTVQGGGEVGNEGVAYVPEKHAVLFGDGDKFQIKAGDQGIRFLFLSAKPLREPIAWGGPIVMNTREELDLAFHELDTNQFIKHRGK